MRIEGADIALGARIRMRRNQLNLSQTDLAEAVGVTYQQVQKYERGMDRISAVMLMKIAHRLDCTVGALLGEEEGAVDDEVAPRLAVPGALDLLEIYSSIRNSATRKRILDLLQDLAGDRADRNAGAGGWHADPSPWRRGIRKPEGPNGSGPRKPGRPRKGGR